MIVGRARACRAVRGKLPTVVAADMVQAGGLIEAVRRLNATGERSLEGRAVAPARARAGTLG